VAGENGKKPATPSIYFKMVFLKAPPVTTRAENKVALGGMKLPLAELNFDPT